MKTKKNITLVIIGLLLTTSYTFSQVLESFIPRYSETIKGDLSIIANNTVSIDQTQPYDGGGGNHSFNTVYVDIDSNSSTFQSSNANFRNPNPTAACLTIDRFC